MTFDPTFMWNEREFYELEMVQIVDQKVNVLKGCNLV